MCLFLKFFILFAVSLYKWVAHILHIRIYGETNKNKHFLKTTAVISKFLIRYGFKGFVVNRALTSLHGGSLETRLTVPLNGIDAINNQIQ